MTQFTIFCVCFVITMIIGAVTFFISDIFESESKDSFVTSWIISTIIAGVAITALLVQNGLLQW